MALDDVVALARAKWASSGLSDDDAAKLRFRVLSPEETAAAVGAKHALPSLLLPYFNLDGTEAEFYRVRFLAQPTTGFGAQVAKPQRYAQRPGSFIGVYFPPVVDWAKVALDSAEDLVITEGELKAACACVHGVACLGLGGVDSWRSAKRCVDMLPVLKEIKWTGRNVCIAYDSDAATNPDVLRAQRQLAEELLERGAVIRVASLPPSAAGVKQGLDDFIVAHGREAFLDLVSDAEATPEAQALHEFNTEVCYVKTPGVIYERLRGTCIAPGAFTAHAYANRVITTFIPAEKEGERPKRKKVPLAERWLKWPARYEVERMTYRPGQPAVSVDEKGRAEINAWGGWGCEPVAGDVGPWTWLLDQAFYGHPAERKWFEQWCAYPVQHPGTKLYQAVLLWSPVKGLGKTAIGYALRGVYGENAIEIGNRQLGSDFTSWARNKQFVLGDEITGTDNRQFADMLKGLVTGEEILINEKFVPEYSLPNCANFLFTSNHVDALYIEEGDRRYFVHEWSGAKGTAAQYAVMDRWLHGERAAGQSKFKGPGPSALFHHLLHVDLTGFNPRGEAMETAAKRVMVELDRSDLGSWVSRLREDPRGLLAALGPDIQIADADTLLHAYSPDGRTKVTSQGLSKALTLAGFAQCNERKPVRCDRIRRLWAVGDQAAKWAKADVEELRAQWSKQTGMKF